MRSGYKSGAGSCFGFGFGDSREDRVDCGRTEPVFVNVGGTGHCEISMEPFTRRGFFKASILT
ncbi:hypothetical protein CUMW_143080 [Citrus unshiu]|nr:hypothetical protein CUMW_143080 [Citrus unshiu]